MTSIMLFDELCRIATILESLSTSERDPAVTIALKAIVQDLDNVIDSSVEADLLTAEVEVA